MITVLSIALILSVIANIMLTHFCKRLLDTNSRLFLDRKGGASCH
jgi:cell division protein FtsL